MTLFIHNGQVLPCADELAEQCKADYGITGDGMQITETEWENAGCLARVIDGNIVLGKTADEIRKDEERAEITALVAKLKALDYIGVKIATGRATAAEYADEIALMKQYSARLDGLGYSSLDR